jgi:LicD family
VIVLVLSLGSALALLATVYNDRDFERFRRSGFKSLVVEGVVAPANRFYSGLLLRHPRALATFAAAWLARSTLPTPFTASAFYVTATFLLLRVLLFARYNARPFAPVWNDADALRVMRDMLSKVDDLFLRLDINYVCADGVVLGYARNGRFIPWDGDIDLAVDQAGWQRFITLGAELAERGLGLDLTHDPHMAVIYSRERPMIHSPVEMRGFAHSWPHIEVSAMSEFDQWPGKVIIGGKAIAREYIRPALRARVEGVEVNLPGQPQHYVHAAFGPDCIDTFVPEAFCNRHRFGYSWPKCATKTPQVSSIHFALLVLLGLIADAFTAHKGFYLLKLSLLCAILAP